jgi:sigma-E factor negative regulatory protein RseC
MDQLEKESFRRRRVYLNEEEGVVTEVRGEKALVKTDRHSMCAQCVAKGYCQMLGGGKEMLSEARNPIGAQPGDIVKIGIPEGIVAKASFVVYMVPTIGLVGGAMLGYYAAKLYSLDVNGVTLLASLAGLAFALMAVKLLSKSLSQKPSYQPEIIRIVSPNELKCEEGDPL